MSKFELIKAEHFGEIEADIYSNGDDMFMTTNQLCECVGESRNTFDSRISRNPYLKSEEFSVSCKLQGTDGKMYNTRVFNEDGIYEITMLSESEKAKEFRTWIRKVLKALRRGQTVNIPTLEAEKVAAQRERSRAMLLNAQKRMFDTVMKTIDNKRLSPIAAEVFGLATLEQVTGQKIDYRPQCETTYSATQIGKEFGVSANKIGKIANANGLKNDTYGITVMDKSPYSSKEVPAFRYNDEGKRKIKELIGMGGG